jgi:hypothetical protein
MLDVLRVLTFVFMASIFFGWAVIMARSLLAYFRLKRAGEDADLRLHIWLITSSYLILIVGAAWDVVENIGGPVEVDDLPLAGPAALLGAVAVVLFLRQGRTTVVRSREPPDTGPVGVMIAATIVVGLVGVVLTALVVTGR